MLTDVAFVEFQVRVALPPGTIEFGETLNVTVGSAEDAVMVTWALVVPPDPVAVAV